MALTERQAIDKVEIIESGIIYVRRARVIMDDGVEIVKKYSRQMWEPDTPIADVTPVKVRQIAEVVWTPAIIAAYIAAKAARTGPGGA